MGSQIIKQPNGLYCVFSSVEDNVTHYNLGKQDIIDLWIEEKKKEIEDSVNNVINELESGNKPYYQFTKTYDEMIDLISEIHGENEAKEVDSIIQQK